MAANPYSGRVGQQLLCTRQQLQACVAENSGNERLRNGGVLAAALWHLRLAYRLYLAELAANYQIESPPPSAAALAQALAAAGKPAAEAAELLAAEEDGWAARLLASACAAETVSPPASSTSSTANVSRRDALPLRDLGAEEESGRPPAAQIAEWLAQLQELVERQRAHMVEC